MASKKGPSKKGPSKKGSSKRGTANKRARTARRADERARAKLGDAREKLAALSEGGRPDRPIRIESAAVVELAAARAGCARCGGAVAVVEHAADAGLRRVRVECKTCGHRRDVWLQLAARLKN